jgi:hypothetical protein
VRRFGGKLERRFSGRQPGIPLAYRKLQVARGREQMAASKTGIKQPLNFGSRVEELEILDYVAGVISILEHQPEAFLEFHDANRNSLQMRLRPLIITQSQLYERLVVQPYSQSGDEIFDLFRHNTTRLAQMESEGIHAEASTIETKYFVESVAYLLRETFEGSPEGMPSAFLDRGVGVFVTLDGLSAEAASKEFRGTTVAAQTEHAKFYLDRLCEYINGRTEPVNWEDSWLIETVNDDEWDALRGSVRKAYEDTLRCVASVEAWNEHQVGMAIGMVAHTAYHLGAIRQIAKGASSTDGLL